MSSGSDIIQYIVMRKDLDWPKGPLIAQGAHASVSAIIKFQDDEDTKEYLGALESMHKVVVEAKSQLQLENTAKKLETAELKFHLWIEQPENIPTCLATKPYRRDVIYPVLKRLRLFK
eukprot:TRINITY_DN657397_c0_g1_i1.p1 TRINITY_DN657397_c0_g1~~TRINITY_DN657397_c0_g1_i1.p1  ORF type:complete len:118 (-),score=23.02 TRINITY_DN657397_c0_g1_i1:123-476(-)